MRAAPRPRPRPVTGDVERHCEATAARRPARGGRRSGRPIGLEIGKPLRGGTAAFVAAATDQSGRGCVLKVAMPLDIEEHDAFGRSVLVHRLAGGRGCAELFEHDDSTPGARPWTRGERTRTADFYLRTWQRRRAESPSVHRGCSGAGAGL